MSLDGVKPSIKGAVSPLVTHELWTAEHCKVGIGEDITTVVTCQQQTICDRQFGRDFAVSTQGLSALPRQVLRKL